MINSLPSYVVNPISGCTRDEEIEKARAIGGRLPFYTYKKLIQRGIVPNPVSNSAEKKNYHK